jgi:hypothetical protein
MGPVTETFLPGLRLAELFYAEVVAPLLAAEFPGLDYAAALIGPGSEVLGFDTPRSADHDWGPRLQVLLSDHELASRVDGVLASRLPQTFLGYPVRSPKTNDPLSRHRVLVAGAREWLAGHLGFDPVDSVRTVDWLSTPTQRLTEITEITEGAVFHDGPGALTRARAALAWYPDDVWRYVLACQCVLFARGRHRGRHGSRGGAGRD